MNRVSLLPRHFYEDAPECVARRLLGKILISNALILKTGAPAPGRRLAGRIVEVEAYQGASDPAAHAFSGVTTRNAVLFGPAGHAYVYLIYGMHSCLNVSCEPEGRAGCVLLRAVQPLDDFSHRGGVEEMRARRGLAATAPPRRITSGPGRLCQAFGITRVTHNGIDVTSPTSELQIVDDTYGADEIVATARIGIRKAVDRPLRFYLAGNPFVSGKH